MDRKELCVLRINEPKMFHVEQKHRHTMMLLTECVVYTMEGAVVSDVYDVSPVLQCGTQPISKIRHAK